MGGGIAIREVVRFGAPVCKKQNYGECQDVPVSPNFLLSDVYTVYTNLYVCMRLRLRDIPWKGGYFLFGSQKACV